MGGGRWWGHVRKTNAKDETKQQLLFRLQLQMPDHRHGHQEDPDVGDQVGDVGEIHKVDHDQAFASNTCIPICSQRSAGKEEGNCNANAPCEYKGRGCESDSAEDGMDEDAVVEGEDTKFDGDERNVVKVAEDKISFSHHHLIIV